MVSLGLTCSHFVSLGFTWSPFVSLGFTREKGKALGPKGKRESLPGQKGKRESLPGQKGKRERCHGGHLNCNSTPHQNRASHARTKRNDFPVAGGLPKGGLTPPNLRSSILFVANPQKHIFCNSKRRKHNFLTTYFK